MTSDLHINGTQISHGYECDWEGPRQPICEEFHSHMQPLQAVELHTAAPPPMCPMKMLFKKQPALQESTAVAKREHDSDSEPLGLPLKKLALLESRCTSSPDDSPMGKGHETNHAANNPHFAETSSTTSLAPCMEKDVQDNVALASKRELEPDSESLGPPLKKLALLEARCMPSADDIPMGKGSETNHAANSPPCAEASSTTSLTPCLEKQIQELETELFYTRSDLQHEQARWSHFRRRAQRLDVWGALMGIAELQGSEAPPPTQNCSQSELVTDKVLEHPLYKKVLACYHQERLLGQRYAQQLETLKADLHLESQRCRTVQETLEDQEKRRRKKLELMLYERDHRLLEKEATIKDLTHRLKKLEAVAEQAAYEQQKMKEYPFLITSLKKEMDKLRMHLEQQRREGGREEDLASEVDSISKAYEDMSEQNARLLAQMDEKDRQNNNLLTERLKNQHNLALLKAEVEANAQALELNEKMRANQEAWMLKMQDVLQTLQTEEKHLARQCRDLQTANGQQEQELIALRLEVEELCQQSARQLMRQPSDSADDSRRKGEELQRLQTKCESVHKKANDSAPKPTPPEIQELADLREQVAGLRIVLNCNVCGRRRKNTIITRCLHLFCSECVEDNLRDRKRKCPQCATKFSESDVKPVFLCEK